MVKLRIQEVAKGRGITTAYQLQKAMNVQPGMAARLWKSETEMIALKTIDALCRTLDCSPGDLFAIVDENANGKPRGRKAKARKGEVWQE